ncbi:MAG TPA: hypothetical protein VFC57_03150 [Aeromicrobium sp.]|nr:hypothetical protein [Aeromicrobium sp.]
MSKSQKKHPLRKLTLIAVIAGVVIAIRNSIADKGGSYTPPATPDRAAAPSEPVVADAPTVEAAPSSSGTVPHAKDFVVSDVADESSIAAELDEKPDEMPPRVRGGRHGAAPDEGPAQELIEKKIDPFGIR